MMGETTEFLVGTLLMSLLLIGLGLVYFMVTLWTVKTGAAFLNLAPDTNWVLLSASLISAASIIGSGRRGGYY